MKSSLLLAATACAAWTALGCANVATRAPSPASSARHARELAVTEAATTLEQITRSGEEERNPSVSPDGRTLAFEIVGKGKTSAVAVVSSDRKKQHFRVPDAAQPSWLADGSGIVFVSLIGKRRQIVQRDLDAPEVGALLVPLGDPQHDAYWPAVAPDGKQLASSLVHVGVIESASRRESRSLRARWFDAALTVNALNGYGVNAIYGTGIEPAWSPDGKRLAFVRKSGGHGHLFVASERGAKAVQITDGPDEDAQPTWSPDGQRIAFCSSHATQGDEAQMSNAANIFMVDADGAALTQLTEGDVFACKPTWARDGSIYFHANSGAGSHIWRLRSKTSPPPAREQAPPPSAPRVETLPPASVEAQRARLPEKAECADPVEGVWRSHTFIDTYRDWYEFTLTIRRAAPGSDRLTGEISSHYWHGGDKDEKPPAVCERRGLEQLVSMQANGKVTEGGRVEFGASSYRVEKMICNGPHGYNPDNFSGTIDPKRQEFQSVNNDGGRAVNEPHVFRRIKCF